MRSEPSEAPRLCIIIVNWNSGPQLRDCLHSITMAEQDGIALSRVVVVDNASCDGSADGLEDVTLPLVILRNSKNRGFAVACNQGANGSGAEYLLFLNPDTRLYEHSLSIPLKTMEQPSCHDIGIVGIQLVNDRGEVSRSCAWFPTPGRFCSYMLGLDRLSSRIFPSHVMAEWSHRENRIVHHVMGAFFLVRRSLFEALGGFDERFFVYLEDLDFSFRAWKTGWRSYYIADARAFHTGGGTSERIKSTRLFYALRSRILYGYKHFGWWAATGLMLGTLILEPVVRLIYGAICCSLTSVKDTVTGYSLLWADLRGILHTSRR